MKKLTIPKVALLTIILIYSVAFTYADSTFVSQSGVKVTSSSPQLQTVRSSIMTESETYNLLYNNAKENNDRMISTIQWVIGMSIVFLLAILGGQIFFNWRINKKEIDYIKKDIEEKIGELKAELIKDIAKRDKDQDIAIKASIDKIEKELKEKITELFNEKDKVAELNDKIRNKEIESLKKEFNDEIKKSEITIEKIQGDIWLLRGVEANAITRYLNTALLKIELNRELKYTLDDIIEVLKKMEDIYEKDYNLLEEVTGKLITKYDDQKDKIISLYKDKPIYRFVDKPDSLSGRYEVEYVKNKPTKE